MITLIKFMVIGVMLEIVSLIFGKCFYDKEHCEITVQFTTGFFFLVALLEIISVIAVILGVTVDLLLYFNLIAMVFVLCFACYVNKEKLNVWKLKKLETSFYILLAVILLQGIFLALFHVKSYGADAYAMGISTRAYETNVLYCENPFTGAEVENIDKKLIISPYVLVVAGIARLFKVHPLSIFHSGIPILMVAIMTLVNYLIASLYTNDRKAKSIFAGALFLVNILFTGYDIRANTGFFMASWHGKMIVANIMLPSTWYYACDAINNDNRKSWIVLFMVMVSSLFFSITGAIFCPMLLMCILLYYSIIKKRITYLMYGIVMLVPAALAIGLYMLI